MVEPPHPLLAQGGKIAELSLFSQLHFCQIQLMSDHATHRFRGQRTRSAHLGGCQG